MTELPSDSQPQEHLFDSTTGGVRFVVQRVPDDGDLLGVALAGPVELARLTGKRLTAVISDLANIVRGKAKP